MSKISVTFEQDDSEPSGCSAVAVSAKTEALLTTLMENFGKHTHLDLIGIVDTTALASLTACICYSSIRANRVGPGHVRQISVG